MSLSNSKLLFCSFKAALREIRREVRQRHSSPSFQAQRSLDASALSSVAHTPAPGSRLHSRTPSGLLGVDLDESLTEGDISNLATHLEETLGEISTKASPYARANLVLSLLL